LVEKGNVLWVPKS